MSDRRLIHKTESGPGNWDFVLEVHQQTTKDGKQMRSARVYTPKERSDSEYKYNSYNFSNFNCEKHKAMMREGYQVVEGKMEGNLAEQSAKEMTQKLTQQGAAACGTSQGTGSMPAMDAMPLAEDEIPF